VRMSICKRCGCIWALPDVAKCDECGGTDFLREERASSVEVIFAAYQKKDDQLRPARGVAVWTDLYPLILEDLQVALGAEGITFVLYGSAGLWLEGIPRPDKGDHLTVKDLDMCVLVQGSAKETRLRLEAIISKQTIVGQFITWGDERYVHLSTQNTLEIKSIDHLVQFSFALKATREDFLAIQTLSAQVSLPTRGRGRIACAGLTFISAGLLSETGLFRTTLFRSDKTEKILIYACMCIGYGTRSTEEVVQCLVVHLAGAGWSDKKAQLTNISVDRNTKRQTKYFEQTRDMVGKLSTVSSFDGAHDDVQKVGKGGATFNPIIESDLGAILKFIETYRFSKKDREELAAKRLAALLEKSGYTDTVKPSKSQLGVLMKQVQAELTKEVDNELMSTVLQIAVDDAKAIWESEVGTAMLIFLTEQLEPVCKTITECSWITSTHRDKVLRGHHALFQRLVEELDERLERASRQSVAPTGQQPVPVMQAPMMLVGVGKRVRIAYHLHYDVVGRVTASTPQRLTVQIEHCYVPGTTTDVVSEHAAMVLRHDGGVMSWLWEPGLISRVED
jgi:hypothetical protein